MGFYRETSAPARIARRQGHTKIRVAPQPANLGDFLFNTIKNFGKTAPTAPAPAPTIKGTIAAPLIIKSAPAPTPAPIPSTRTFSPVSSAPTSPTPAPVTTTPSFSPATSPAPTPVASGATIPGTAPESGGSTSGGAPPSSSAPFYDAPQTIRFASDATPLPDATIPDASGGAEIYNPDGTPVTPAAKVATMADKFKNLPTAAKIGGAFVIYLLLSRR